jgi:hypothetical protein
MRLRAYNNYRLWYLSVSVKDLERHDYIHNGRGKDHNRTKRRDEKYAEVGGGEAYDDKDSLN